jgi:putative N6-adenine-specific DNA methylase
MIELFVTCAQGLEELLLEEIQALGFDKVKTGFRGVTVEVEGLQAVYRLNYCSRIASRVLYPLTKFNCYNAKSLYKEASEIDWLQYIPRGKTFAIDANVTHKQLRNSLFAAQVVKDAICDQFRAKTGARPNVEPKDPDVQLNLFIREPYAILSFDTSGVPLHKRGYRLEGVEAPLQENLAAALLKIGEYKEEELLCDPCCGSGTLLIEAALMATHTPPGYLRNQWGFMFLPEFVQQEWLKVKVEADKGRKSLKAGHIFGCDINKNAVRVTKTNLRAAGFAQAIDVVQYDFRDYEPPVPPTLVFTNPPHGRRLDDEESLKPLYRSLGDFLKRKTAKPARGFVFVGSLELSKEVGLSPKRRHVLTNAGLESRLLEFDLY